MCALQDVRACRPTASSSTPTARDTPGARREKTEQTYLLHDTGLALGKGDVTTRLVLDELDLNLSSLAAGLVVVVVIVVGSSAGALDAAVLHAEGAIAVVVDRGRRVLVVLGDFAGHGGERDVRVEDWLAAVFGGRGPKLDAAECGELAGVLAWFGRAGKMLQNELQTG